MHGPFKIAVVAAFGLASGVGSCGPADELTEFGGVSALLPASLEWRAGGTEELGGVVLEGPWDGAFGPDGTSAVVDWRGSSVLLIDSTGRAVATLGSRGTGPGQFLQPAMVGFTPDSLLWVSDRDNGRITRFGLDGRVHGTVTRGHESIPGTNWSARAGWYLAGGYALGDASRRPGTQSDSDGSARQPIVLWRPDAERLEVVDWVPAGAQRALQIPTSRGVAIGTFQVIAGWPVIGVESESRWFFVLDRFPAEKGRGEITITRYSASGRRMDVATIPYDPQVVDDDVRRWLHGFAQTYEEEPRFGGTVQASDVIGALWIPDYLPPVREVLADSTGYWFLRERDYSDSAAYGRWERYDLAGRPIAHVLLPGTLRALAGSESAILGWRPDAMNVPVVERYTVRLSGTEAR